MAGIGDEVFQELLTNNTVNISSNLDTSNINPKFDTVIRLLSSIQNNVSQSSIQDSYYDRYNKSDNSNSQISSGRYRDRLDEKSNKIDPQLINDIKNLSQSSNSEIRNIHKNIRKNLLNPRNIQKNAYKSIGDAERKLLVNLINNWYHDFKDYQQDFKDTKAALKKSFKDAKYRNVTSRARRIELGNERLQADIEDIVRTPFKILEDAAQKVYTVWDNNLRLINQTQGYSKADLQSLLGSYSNRLKSEGLSSVISSSDITENLANVLKSGLSGKAAEEFAYIATKLNAAIPTQDFFNYADTYASLAANAIRTGKSQSEAVEYANKQLELFASDVAYASRQITGGFNTGLQNASDLFQKATEISIAARTNNPSQLAGVLTSVSAITGAIAPDLANSIVDAIYTAAVGGNNSQIVALRSLAGINASNTEFLQQFSSDPQQVFSTLFNNLAELQHMSEDNYMEVAEGLSNIFGLDTSAFARVDFSYLAKAINNMDVSDAALNENLKELASGQSTATAEQMRIRQINEYLVNEGLSYVLDNEVARQVQQHMWDEQIAMDIMENQFAIDIVGKGREHLNSIRNLLVQVVSVLAPVTALVKPVNLIRTQIEALQDKYGRVQKILEEGKVGEGNSKVKKNLTTRGKQLNLTNSYLKMLTESKGVKGTANYEWSNNGTSRFANAVSKSFAKSVGNIVGGYSITSFLNGADNAQSEININRLNSNFNRMLDSISDFFGDNVKTKIDSAIETEKTKLTKQALGAITSSTIDKLAQQYLKNPEKYGIADILYESKLASSKASSLKSFTNEVQERALELTKQRVKKDLEEQAKKEASDKASQLITKQAKEGKFGQSGFEAWMDTASKYGISDFNAAIEELGYDISDLRGYFEELEVQAGTEKALKREQDEEMFWAETQRLLNMANINIHDVFDKGDVMGIFWPGVDAWLSDIDSNGATKGVGFRGEMNIWFETVDNDLNSFHKEMITEFKGFRTDWTEYYIKHSDYNAKLGLNEKGSAYNTALQAIKKAEKQSSEDQINALTEALVTSPINDLMDPTVQQNVFLAQILRVVQGIFQQNNTQGKLKLPDAIAALATGMTVSEVGSTGTATTAGNKEATPISAS